MRLTQILLLESKTLKKHKLPGGHLYRGKWKIIIPPTALEVAKLGRDLEVEDQNMFYLRHPYLDKEESLSHLASREYLTNSIRGIREYRMNKFSKPVRLSDHLENLRVTESWEDYK